MPRKCYRPLYTSAKLFSDGDSILKNASPEHNSRRHCEKHLISMEISREKGSVAQLVVRQIPALKVASSILAWVNFCSRKRIRMDCVHLQSDGPVLFFRARSRCFPGALRGLSEIRARTPRRATATCTTDVPYDDCSNSSAHLRNTLASGDIATDAPPQATITITSLDLNQGSSHPEMSVANTLQGINHLPS